MAVLAHCFEGLQQAVSGFWQTPPALPKASHHRASSSSSLNRRRLTTTSIRRHKQKQRERHFNRQQTLSQPTKSRSQWPRSGSGAGGGGAREGGGGGRGYRSHTREWETYRCNPLNIRLTPTPHWRAILADLYVLYRIR